MVVTSIDKFWKLLADSGLVTAARLADLQAEFDQLRGVGSANPPLLAEWLLAEGVITRYHADVLLKGRPGPFVFGDFLVRDIIPAGRLAGTFRAVHQPTGHPVLLVFFGGNRPGDPMSWATTVTYGMNCFELDEPQLATCHEMVDIGVYRFAVLDDLRGQVLAKVLQNGRPLSVPHAAGLMYDVAMALDILHACGQSHGNVCPENIMVTDGGHGQLLYFPLSRTDYTRCVPLDALAADYAAPELNPQQPLPTPAADIYALGCTFYHALTGRPPFADPPADVAQKMVRHATQPIAPLHQQSSSHQQSPLHQSALHQNAVPEGANLVVSYMMAKNVRTRYRDAKTVMASLRPWLDPSRAPPAALPATRAAYQGVAQRRRAAVAAAAVQARDAAAAVAMSPPPPAPPPTPAGTIPVAVATPAVEPQEFGQVNVNPVAGQTVTSGPRSPAFEKPWWQKRANQNKLIAAGSVALVALVAIVALTRMGSETTPQQTSVAEKAASPAANTNSEQPVAPTRPAESASGTPGGTPGPSDVLAEDVIGDDGRTLWVAPTQGSPPDLRYIPAGAQTVIMLRTADLFSDGSGKGLRAAMGPAGSWLANWIKTKTTFELDEIERLDIALYPSEAGEIEYSLVVYPSEKLPKEGLLARWGNPTAQRYAEGTYFQRGQTAFYIPQSQANAFACGNVKQMHGVIDTLEEAAWLAAPLEKLRLQTEAQRQVNILFLPDYLRSTRETLYPGRLSPLHEVISWVLGPGEDVKAGLLSAHASAQLFLELRLFCARQKQPQVMARELYGRLGQASGRLSAHLLSLSVSQYSQPVLAGMPGMLRSLHQYTRHDRDQPKGQQAVLRCYLPPRAALHLAAATDLALLESGGTSAGGSAPESKTQTVWERLKQPTTLAFEKDNLINAMQLLSDDIGVPIEILGNDLKLEGITKNQSFGIDMRDQPAEAILTTIALRANPTKVSDPQDPALKLIYVVKEKHQGGADVIWITTRAAAAQRGDPVPPQFQMKAEK